MVLDASVHGMRIATSGVDRYEIDKSKRTLSWFLGLWVFLSIMWLSLFFLLFSQREENGSRFNMEYLITNHYLVGTV